MMNKKIMWIMLFVVVCILIAVFTGGFITAINITSSDSNNEDKSEPDASHDETGKEINETTTEYDFEERDRYMILVLGDSIGAGMGDDTGLGIGKGYGKLIEKEKSLETEVVNLAQPGAEISDMMKVMNDDETMRIIGKADIIFISIGGNDMNHLYDLRKTVSAIDYEEALGVFIDDLGKTFELINEANGDVKTVVIGLYNPYGDEIGEELRVMLLKWNYRTELLVSSYPQSVYIPTYDLFKYNLDEYLTIDDFHPSAAGYDAIVKRLYEVLNGV